MGMELLKVLITVKTYPIPSRKYGELVCTAGVNEDGEFIRLYPINLRDLPYTQQYKKYQWIEIKAERHRGRDTRKESWRPNCDTLQVLGEPIGTGKGDWSERAQFVLKNQAQSMEDLWQRQELDNTSLGIIRPKAIEDLVISPDEPEWKPAFLEELRQAQFWEDRTTKDPPRKLPFKFHFRFRCDDDRCKGHKMMIEDWEVGALFWNMVDQGHSQDDASQIVRDKFLNELCGPARDPHFYVGTVLEYPKSWVIIGVFWPKYDPQQSLFD